MNPSEIIIDPELRDLLPPLPEDERPAALQATKSQRTAKPMTADDVHSLATDIYRRTESLMSRIKKTSKGAGAPFLGSWEHCGRHRKGSPNSPTKSTPRERGHNETNWN